MYCVLYYTRCGPIILLYRKHLCENRAVFIVIGEDLKLFSLTRIYILHVKLGTGSDFFNRKGSRFRSLFNKNTQ